jgi:rhodanese-related sulfurtransferase
VALADKVRQMSLDWLTEGNHKISLEGFIEKWEAGEAILLDVRSDEEASLFSLEAFGIRIPLNELPDRLSEVPKDKLVCPMCPGKIRATLAYAVLIEAGFTNVKVLASTPAELVDYLKPGVAKRLAKVLK